MSMHEYSSISPLRPWACFIHSLTAGSLDAEQCFAPYWDMNCKQSWSPRSCGWWSDWGSVQGLRPAPCTSEPAARPSPLLHSSPALAIPCRGEPWRGILQLPTTPSLYLSVHSTGAEPQPGLSPLKLMLTEACTVRASLLIHHSQPLSPKRLPDCWQDLSTGCCLPTWQRWDWLIRPATFFFNYWKPLGPAGLKPKPSTPPHTGTLSPDS